MTESKLDVSPSGLRGLNRLAIKLNTMVAKAQITDWHLGPGPMYLKPVTEYCLKVIGMQPLLSIHYRQS